MAVTRPDVILPRALWVNLYATTGIAVGTAVSIYNKGNNASYLMVKATTPAPAVNTGIPLYAGPSGSFAAVSASEVGLWAYSELGTILLVQE